LDFATVVLFLLVGVIEIISVMLVNRRLSYEHDFMVERGTAGDQLGEWLTRKESDAEDAPMMIDVLAARVGRALFQTQRFSSMQEASVDSRMQNKWNSKVQEAVKRKMPIGYKLLFKVAEELGFNLEEIMEQGELTEFINAARENRLDLFIASPNSSSPQTENKFNMR